MGAIPTGNSGYVLEIIPSGSSTSYTVKNEWIKQGSFQVKDEPRIASSWTDESGTKHTSYIGCRRTVKVTLCQYEKGRYIDDERVTAVRGILGTRRAELYFEERKSGVVEVNQGTYELKAVTEKQAYSDSNFIFYAETTLEWEEV